MAGAPREARDVWDELRIELNIGQYLDLLGTARAETDATRRPPDRALQVGQVHRRTSPAHRRRPCRPARPAADRSSAPIGDPLGEAFQLRDDLLGAFGDSARTGKPVGDDLREGKPTTLLAEATARADDRQRSLLGRVGRPDLTAGEVTGIQDVLVSSGARAAVEAHIEELANQAVDALDGSDLDGGAHEALVQLAWYVARRDS